MPREAVAARLARARSIVAALEAAYPHSTCALDHDGPWQLLVATVLSAQTTDLKVNEATADLFARYPTAADLAQADVAAVGRTIGTLGLWRNKAKHIVGLSQAIVQVHGGDVPRTLSELTRLPGVGRKTATAVLGTAFGIAAGVTVDTHMLRINRLLRLSTRKDPDAMAADLEALVPRQGWASYTHRIIDHGRLVCVARRPRCGACPLESLCPSARSPRIGYRPENDARIPASAKGLSWRVRHR